MKNNRTFKHAREVLNSIGARKREELNGLMEVLSCQSYLANEIKSLLSFHVGIIVTTQCANELQQHYRKLIKEGKFND